MLTHGGSVFKAEVACNLTRACEDKDMRKLGLIGGLGPGSTIHYYRELVAARAGEMLIVHADMDRVLGDVQRGDRAGLVAYFAGLIDRLAGGGADVAAISAITPHICIRELERISALPLVNIIEETGKEIRARGYRRVALFGTRFVVESRMYGMLERSRRAGAGSSGCDSRRVHENRRGRNRRTGHFNENRTGVAGRRDRAGGNRSGTDFR
jgi:hypothetical protein